jgi:ribosomal protein L11 methyltransferase
LIELVPGGFEEREVPGWLELAVYGGVAEESALRARFGEVRSEPVEPGWEDRWRAFHLAVVVGRLWIGPPWEPPADGLEPVVIDPGRAFGTGSHPTTQLCLELLQRLPPASLLDIGCGSGVLAISAARLGFCPVVAVDSDPAAIDACDRNAARNGVMVECLLADALRDELPVTDVAVANISGPVVEQLASRLGCPRFVVSGFMATDRLSLPRFIVEQARELDGWGAYLLARRQ